jgi:hypothetical protein
LLLTFAFCSPIIEALEKTPRRAQVRRSVASGDWGKDWTWSLPMAEGGLLSSESQGDLFRSGQEPAATGALAKPVSAGTRALHYEPVKFINSEGRANLALARKAAESKIGSALQPAADTRATHGGVNPPLHGDVKSPLQGEAKSPPPRPWTLPPQGLAVFHGDKDTARLSHYFLPRLLLQGKRVLMLDGANCADPRLLERLARQRRVPFEQFSRQIQIARAFTCFQLTELIARVPRLLTDFPAELLIVTAFPELYYDEDVRDWNARVAFEQALANLQRWARGGDFTSSDNEEGAVGVSRLASHASVEGGSAAPTCGKPLAFRPILDPSSISAQAGRLSLPACAEEVLQDARPSERRSLSASQAAEPQVIVHQIERNSDKGGAASPKVSATREPGLALTVAVFSSATTFMPSPARKRFFEKVCAAGSEVWQFNSNAEGKLGLVCRKCIVGLGLPAHRGIAEFLHSPLSPLGERGRG